MYKVPGGCKNYPGARAMDEGRRHAGRLSSPDARGIGALSDTRHCRSRRGLARGLTFGSVMRALRGRRLTIVGLGLATVVALTIVALVVSATMDLARFDRAETRRAVSIHAAGQVLAPGISVRAIDLQGTLARLGYSETRAAPAAPGQFRRAASVWDIVLREEPGRVRVEVRDERIARVTRDGKEVASAALDGLVLAGGAELAGEDYRPIKLANAPHVLIDAVLAAEDHRFFEHGALDVRGLSRAIWANLRAGKVTEGGSTITQQLVKNRLLTPGRTMTRKIREAWLATVIEWRYSKEQILEAYLERIYLGQRGALAIRGVGAAARAYFAKEVHQLTPAEAALLAGMVRAPNSYSPVIDPERARQRRNVVLGRMRELEMLDAAAYDRARREPSVRRRRPRPGQTAPYFVDVVRQEVEERSSAAAPASSRPSTSRCSASPRTPWPVDSTSLEASRPASPARRSARAPAGRARRARPGHGRDPRLRRRPRLPDEPVQPRDARPSPGGLGLQAVRLPSRPCPRGAVPFTAATMVEDAPITISVDGKPWTPRNYDDRYEGRVSVRRALEQSLNGATVRIAQVVGAPAIAETRGARPAAERRPVPALALGAVEVTPLALAAAYAPLANGGVRPTTHAVRAVYQADGDAIPPAQEPATTAVLSPAEAYLMTSLLQGVVRSERAPPPTRSPRAGRSRARRAPPTRDATRGSSAIRRGWSPPSGWGSMTTNRTG